MTRIVLSIIIIAVAISVAKDLSKKNMTLLDYVDHLVSQDKKLCTHLK